MKRTAIQLYYINTSEANAINIIHLGTK